MNVPNEAHHRLLAAFGIAVASGDAAALASILSEDAVLLADGGGKVMAALNPIRGADRIARFFIGVVQKFGPLGGDIIPELVEVNGLPAVLVRHGGRIDQLLTLQTDGARITTVYVVRNPDKLSSLSWPSTATAIST